jgi:Zn-dependent protease
MNPLLWLLTGSVPLFRAFGIDVRAHASLILLVGIWVLTQLAAWQMIATLVTLLFLAVLLHEFGHCFAARALGGSADRIIMWPLGGLAEASPPHRPLPSFLTVAAGPATNLVLALLCMGTLWAMGKMPGEWVSTVMSAGEWHSVSAYVTLFGAINVSLMLFNLLPIYPLDGGQMLQSILWPMVGYLRSMVASCWVGVVGGAGLALFGLSSMNLWLVVLAISCVMTCLQRLAYAKAAAAEGYEEEPLYAAAAAAPRRHRTSRWSTWKARRQIRAEQVEQAQVDAILEKVSQRGMHSLSWLEKRALRRATERQRQREMVGARRRY